MLPRPWRLALTAGWNLAESLGLPVAGYLAGAALGGQAVGMVVATCVLWLTVAIRKVVMRRVPGLLAISALILTLQTALVIATGSTLVFLLQFPLANVALCALFARTAPTSKPLVAQLAAEVAGLRQPSPAEFAAAWMGKALKPEYRGSASGAERSAVPDALACERLVAISGRDRAWSPGR